MQLKLSHHFSKVHWVLYTPKMRHIISKTKVKQPKAQETEQKESMMYDKYGNLKDPIYNDNLNAEQTYWALIFAAIGILCVWAGFFMTIHPLINILVYVFIFIMCFVIWFW